MSRVPMVDADNESAELQPVFEQLRRTRGRVPGMYRTLAQHPAVVAAHRAYFHAALDTGVLPRAFKEKIVYKVVRMRGSTYSSASHRSYAIKHGVPETELDAIDRSDYRTLDPALAVVLEFAEEMTRTRGVVPDALFDRLRERYSPKEIVELAALVGVVDLGCVLGAVFDLKPD